MTCVNSKSKKNVKPFRVFGWCGRGVVDDHHDDVSWLGNFSEEPDRVGDEPEGLGDLWVAKQRKNERWNVVENKKATATQTIGILSIKYAYYAKE